MDDIRVRDYAPVNSLVLTENHPAKARFPAIDIHAHSNAKTPQELAAWERTMDEVGVETTVVLTGATGEAFDRMADLYLTRPGRFQVYCGVLATDLDKPDYPQRPRPSSSAVTARARAASASFRTRAWALPAGPTSRVPPPARRRCAARSVFPQMRRAEDSGRRAYRGPSVVLEAARCLPGASAAVSAFQSARKRHSHARRVDRLARSHGRETSADHVHRLPSRQSRP